MRARLHVTFRIFMRNKFIYRLELEEAAATSAAEYFQPDERLAENSGLSR